MELNAQTVKKIVKEEEQDKGWEEHNRKWEANQEEIRKLHKKINWKYDTIIGALGARWGLRSEATFRNALKDILKDFDVEVLNINEYDDKGEVFGRPETIELDIIIINGKLIICELKSSMSRADMYAFYKKAMHYEKVHERQADRLAVVSPMVEEKALEVAKQLKIKVYSYADDIGEDLAGSLPQ